MFSVSHLRLLGEKIEQMSKNEYLCHGMCAGINPLLLHISLKRFDLQRGRREGMSKNQGGGWRHMGAGDRADVEKTWW